MFNRVRHSVQAIVSYVIHSLRVQIGGLAATYGLCVSAYVIAHYVIGERWVALSLLNDMAHWLTLFSLAALLLIAFSGRYRRVWVVYTLPGAVMFGLWYGGQYLPKPAPDSTPDDRDLVVVTYNAGALFVPLLQQLDFFPDADIIGFQELSEAMQVRSEQPLEIFAKNRAIHSHYPLIEDSFRTITWDEGDDTNIVAVRAQILFQGKAIAVYSLHARRPVLTLRPLAYDNAERQQAIDAIITAIQAESGPVIVLCDCNMSDRTAPYQQMAAHLHDAWRAQGRGLGLTAPAPHGATGFPITLSRVDYVWHSDHFETVEVSLLPTISDHYPVQARLRLKPDG